MAQPRTGAARAYDPSPCYVPVGGTVVSGWDAVAAAVPEATRVVAVDGPAALDWDRVILHLAAALDRRGRGVDLADMRRHFHPWGSILEVTRPRELPDDPDFAPLATVEMRALLASLPTLRCGPGRVGLVAGPGAALAPHDSLWYLDVPKRYAEAAMADGTGRNLGQPQEAGPGSAKRLFFTDWPVIDRHRDAIAPRVDQWIDAQQIDRPTALEGSSLRRTLGRLATMPFRTRPTFNSTPWGGHWGQRVLGVNPGAPNTALGYELIAPEAGALLGTPGCAVEIPLQLISSQHAEALLGPWVRSQFGSSFPIRFDYLDTLDGGNLSVHCHPRQEFMTRFFGWPYTQHESYYVMVAGPGSKVFLGLRSGVDLDAFHAAANASARHLQPLDIDDYVQCFRAVPHQLFMIPAGTPHGSGVGNVILEVSATPYLYSLRFYDWLRRDARDRLRPVHIDHAFDNLDTQRSGEAVPRDLVQHPTVLRSGPGWREERLGSLPEVFFEVRRLALREGHRAPDRTDDRFHVLNVVEGDGAVIVPAAGPSHLVNYAETIVVPAAVGSYELQSLGSGPVRVVKALVR